MRAAFDCIRWTALWLLLIAAAGGAEPSASDAAIDRHFNSYCDYTGGLGIRHVPAHKYDYEFRQRLKETKDTELKRLFVLRRLYPEVETALEDFEQGRIRVSKTAYRQMTPTEREAASKGIHTGIQDLAVLDPDDEFGEIVEFRGRLKTAERDSWRPKQSSLQQAREP